MSSMNTLEWICNRYKLNPKARRLPVAIPNVGRNNLAEWFRELGFTRGAEIGVERGVFAETICKANPNLQLYACDAWQAYKGYRDHVSQEKLDAIYQEAKERLKPYNVTFVRRFSDELAPSFKDGFFDFVYIDANHELPYIINDIAQWSRKVRSGGIVAGHDYIFNKPLNTRNHVVPAVNCYTYAYRIRPWFLLGAKAKNPGEVRDTARSWFWVKE